MADRFLAGRPAAPLADPSQGSRGGESRSLPTPDWLRHELVVTGPAEAVAALREAAAGAGGIPWAYPDLDQDEEDRVYALLHPPDGSSGMNLHDARALARLLRGAVETHQVRVTSAHGRSRACPFDLHALVPVPDRLLRLGPDDPASIAWLRQHWGTTRALRHVRLREEASDRRLRRSARLRYEFWSSDWTPWAAFATLRTRWPALVFDLRPDYGDV